jgi:hypothetical protein
VCCLDFFSQYDDSCAVRRFIKAAMIWCLRPA